MAGGGVSRQSVPTTRWLMAVSEVMPPLDGAGAVAERLLLLVHYGVDWDGWVGSYRAKYWEQLLPDRVVVATYRSDSLRRWWQAMADELGSYPRSAAERVELEQLLGAPEQAAVLRLLRYEAEALLLRTRIVAEANRAARADRRTGRVGEVAGCKS